MSSVLQRDVNNSEVKLEPLSVTTVRGGPWGHKIILSTKAFAITRAVVFGRGTTSTHFVKYL
jgi:hypothetical protein